MRKTIIIIATIFLLFAVFLSIKYTMQKSETIYRLDIGKNPTKILYGHLKMGGENPAGHEINVNSLYITIDGKPVLPVMGEMHFSRYPHKYWEEEILKMKACGINIISTYVFWIHHEEIKGEWDWSGDKNLRDFIELCSKHGLYAFVRIGPFAHGECRNGGFPDWLWGKSYLRTNDPVYFSYVREFYSQISNQLKGLLYKDGGPVIGIQLENEYRPWLSGGAEHIRNLKRIANEVGIKVPLYTETGWAGSPIPKDEVIPVFGGYPAAPWDMNIKKRDPCLCYFFFDYEKARPDLDKPPLDKNADFSRYPFAACEAGGGIQVTYHRRPIISADDIGSLAMVQVGNGTNLMGYYMFHGGSHPVGKLTTMQETMGRPDSLEYPVISYDFQAPIREFGQISDSYHKLRILHLFLNDFGDMLAPMRLALPGKMPSDRYDVETLRFAARVKDDSGFLFINNYHRNTELREIKDIKIELKTENQTLDLPHSAFTLKKGKYFIWPFNLFLHSSLLKYSTSQLICKVNNKDVETYFFFEPDGITSEYCFDSKTIKNIKVDGGKINRSENESFISYLKAGTDCVIQIETMEGSRVDVVTLSQEQAEHLWKAKIWGKERVFLAEANLLFKDQKLLIYGTNPERFSFSVFPAPDKDLFVNLKSLSRSNDGMMSKYVIQRPIKNVTLSINKLPSKSDAPEWSVQIPENALEGINDLFLYIYYEGDVGRATLNGELISDNFYNGTRWEIGLKRFAPDVLGNRINLQVTPLYKDAKIYLEKWPEFKGEKVADIMKIEAIPEYRVSVTADQ